jgi:hypothetical protein
VSVHGDNRVGANKQVVIVVYNKTEERTTEIINNRLSAKLHATNTVHISVQHSSSNLQCNIRTQILRRTEAFIHDDIL